ncbi:hypothetical protein [Tropicimonas sp. IMCC34011]|uniref:hypothetical protein n=1 Tax=Tropicimonas sp. IMCC34011 TaxID=2248759 RepID=UPI000E254EFA|nr:hypothetical protein [Tropicimonas sp. IMCC34011]
MSDDYALVDFALTQAEPAAVIPALGRSFATVAAAALARSADASGPERGFLARLRGRRRRPAELPALRVQPASSLPDAPLMQPVATDLGFSARGGAMRVTAPLGSARLTLIELHEGNEGISPICQALSRELGGAEVFYFRNSGPRHPGADYAFHVYEGGRATRRASSRSPLGDAPEAPWEAIDGGMPHPVEVDSLPRPDPPAWQVMTPERQASILAALGLDPATLFDPPAPGAVQVALGTDPGGKPLSEALTRSGLRAPPGFAGPPAAPPDPEPQQAMGPTDALETDAEIPDPGSSDWEEEVTALLIEAVESGLPEESQIAWLNDLTRRLGAGDIDGALSDARTLMEAGGQDENERRATAARLYRLFGRALD